MGVVLPASEVYDMTDMTVADKPHVAAVDIANTQTRVYQSYECGVTISVTGFSASNGSTTFEMEPGGGAATRRVASLHDSNSKQDGCTKWDPT